MTISTTERRAGPYIGNGATAAFSFSFKVFAGADVQVIRTSLDAVETILALSTDYTVTLNGNQDANPGGTVTLVAPLASGLKLTILSNLAPVQAAVFTNTGGWWPRVLNDSLDRATIMIQQAFEKLNRAILMPASSSQSPAEYAAGLLGARDAANAAANASAASASAAAGSATSSALQASNASAWAAAAASAATVTGEALAYFQGVYWGELAIAPTVDIAADDIYFDTVLEQFRVYNGSAWVTVGDWLVGPQGPTGPQGPIGLTGATGPAGTVSAAGDGTLGAPGIAFSSDTDTGRYRPGADQMTDVVGGVASLLHLAGGYVRRGKPAAFWATMAPLANIGGAGVVCKSSEFSNVTEQLDTESCFSTTTGAFTAPVTGVYEFQATASIGGSSPNVGTVWNGTLQFRKGGVAIGAPAYGYGPNGSNFTTIAQTIRVSLTAGETIDAVITPQNSTTIHVASGQITGRLI